MAYTLGEAAKVTGKSKATISKAIKTGRISASKDETGTFAIDPSELHRVYPVAKVNEPNETPLTPQVNTENAGLIRELRARLEVIQDRLADKETTISDLRDDRDKWRQQATGLLEDKRPRGIWARLTGK